MTWVRRGPRAQRRGRHARDRRPAVIWRLVARLTRCSCRHLYYLDHRTRSHHIRNDRP